MFPPTRKQPPATSHRQPNRDERILLGLALYLSLLMTLLLAGCSSSKPDRDDSTTTLAVQTKPSHDPDPNQVPRVRLGALPCPGLFTLYDLANPDKLGIARYSSMPRFLDDTDETGRGIIYTRRAGFLDLAHLRESMDWCWYVSQHVKPALRAGKTTLKIKGYDDSTFHLQFHYPAGWETLPPEDKETILSELSIRIAQRVAFNAMTWHEITTWFGYRTTVIVPEQQSSFTYEDTISHLVGIRAGAEALRQPVGAWDLSATQSLSRELKNLQVVSRAQAAQAVQQVKGHWWKNGQCTRRNLDMGQHDGVFHPWVIRNAPWGDAAPASFTLPTLRNVHGHDFTGLWTMTIEPDPFTPDQVLAVSPSEPHLINPETHFPLLISLIHDQMKEKFGPNFDRPYDDAPTPPAHPKPTLVADGSLD
jgi:hypothetical protein